MVAHFHYFGRVKPSTSAYCTWWTFFQCTLSVSNEFLMALISIQRHILIFNSHLLRIRIKRFYLYYFPLLLCIIYPMFLYLSLVVIYLCDGTLWDFTLNLCGLANCFSCEQSNISNIRLGNQYGFTIIADYYCEYGTCDACCQAKTSLSTNGLIAETKTYDKTVS